MDFADLAASLMPFASCAYALNRTPTCSMLLMLVVAFAALSFIRQELNELLCSGYRFQCMLMWSVAVTIVVAEVSVAQ